jgi:predicted metal-dependent hydrolase
MTARLRLRDLFGTRTREKRQTDGDTRPLEGQARRITLAGASVDYRLVRARRRSIGMQIDFSGLTVRAPRWVPLREIDEVLSKRGSWILRSLDEWRARRRHVMPREWKTGAAILYRGSELALVVEAAPHGAIEADLINLTVLHPAARDQREVETFVTRWLREEAERLIVPLALDYAARVTDIVPTVKLSRARSEWGSCDQHGVIRLNWRLILLPPELALYIVAHEVAHLVHLNHSARFWSLVERLHPGSSRARQTLDDWTALLEA